MKVFVDTSAFYALASETDEVHQAAHLIQERLKRDSVPLVTTNYVALETVSLLQRRHGVIYAGRFGDSVLEGIDIVWIDAAQHWAAWKLWKNQPKRGLSLVDCASFIVMRGQGIRHAFAFDRQFREAGFALLTEPADRVAERRGVYRTRRLRR